MYTHILLVCVYKSTHQFNIDVHIILLCWVFRQHELPYKTMFVYVSCWEGKGEGRLEVVTWGFAKKIGS
jgi:hypothetical protein